MSKVTNPKHVVHETAVQRYLTVNAVADHFGVSRMSVYRAIDRGEIVAIRVGRNLRVPAEELRRVRVNQTVMPGEMGHVAQMAAQAEAKRQKRAVA